MKMLIVIWILLSLGASVYLYVKLVSRPLSRKFAKWLRTSRKKTQKAVNISISAFYILTTGISLWYFKEEVTTVITSGLFFVSVVSAKISLESSTVYLLNPLENSEKIESILLLLTFFSLFVLILSGVHLF